MERWRVHPGCTINVSATVGVANPKPDGFLSFYYTNPSQPSPPHGGALHWIPHRPSDFPTFPHGYRGTSN